MIPTKKDADKAYYQLVELTIKYNFKYIIEFEPKTVEAIYENKEGVTLHIKIPREQDLMANLYYFYQASINAIKKHYEGIKE